MMSACMVQAEMLLAGRPNGEIDRALIFDPGQLGATDSVDFCGACHSTSWDVRLSGKTGNSTVILPGYRLENSRCWGKGDARLSFGTLLKPQLTVVAQPGYEMGQRAASILLEMLSSDEGVDPSSWEKIITLKAEIRLRNSAVCPEGKSA
jgi:hypothetical protein